LFLGSDRNSWSTYFIGQAIQGTYALYCPHELSSDDMDNA